MTRPSPTTSRRPARWIGMLDPVKPAPAKRSLQYFFVACAAEDLDRVAPLIESAEADGHRFWLPHRHPRSAAEIAAAAEASAALIVFCSAQSPRAEDMLAEAARVGKRIVPVMLDGGEAPDAVLYHISVHDLVTTDDPDWRLKFKRALGKLDTLPAPSSAKVVQLRPAPPQVKIVRQTPAPVRVAAPRPPSRAPALSPRPRRKSYTQSFINAFAAGAMALFGFAILELTGGPPTGHEIEDVAVEMQDAAKDVTEAATPI